MVYNAVVCFWDMHKVVLCSKIEVPDTLQVAYPSNHYVNTL